MLQHHPDDVEVDGEDIVTLRCPMHRVRAVPCDWSTSFQMDDESDPTPADFARNVMVQGSEQLAAHMADRHHL